MVAELYGASIQAIIDGPTGAESALVDADPEVHWTK